MPANQFPAAGLAVDFASNITRSMPAPGREIASKKKIAAIKGGLYYLYRTIQIMEKLNR
uniref:Uncharacterized protein n=1 Tax=Escherichia coli TaxID=562 RepID=A0A7U2D5U0_ECOLX|nr:hypothetical protein JL587_00275 [Escherichia coli]